MGMTVDKKSPLTQFLRTLLRQRDLLIEAVDRDNEALRILSSPALPEALDSRKRRGWTKRDEKRLNCLRGFDGGYVPSCRVAKLVCRFRPSSDIAPYSVLFSNALIDGTAREATSLLYAAMKAHGELLESARGIAQDDDKEQEFDASVWELNEAVSSLLPFAKPAGDTVVDDLESEMKKRKPTAATVAIIRAIQGGKDNDSVVTQTGCSADVVRGVRSKLKAGKYEI